MKRLSALLIVLILVLSGCGVVQDGIDLDNTSSANLTSLPSVGETSISPENQAPQQYASDSISESSPPLGPSSLVLPEQIATEGAAPLTVTFIDVGQGDAILIQDNGQTMLVDGGDRSASDIMYTVLNKKGITYLDALVVTHAHEDHVGGVSGALHQVTGVGTVYCPVESHDTQVFGNFLRSLEAIEVGTMASDGYMITTQDRYTDSFTIGSTQVTLYWPQQYSETELDINDTSIVVRLTRDQYSFLLTGDAERAAEQLLLDAGVELRSDVLKVGHHGSDTSTTYPFLREVSPTYAVIQVGSGNSYGHPHENLMSRLRDADVEVYRTDMQGDIVFVVYEDSLYMSTQYESATPTNPTGEFQVPPPQSLLDGFVGNINNKKLHTGTCQSLPLESNRIYFDSKADALAEGYLDMCGNCNP